jgi:hypothetical protein
VSLAALISFVKVREANSVRLTRTENELDKSLENSPELYKLKRGAFNNIGKGRGRSASVKKQRSPFKHIGRKR